MKPKHPPLRRILILSSLPSSLNSYPSSSLFTATPLYLSFYSSALSRVPVHTAMYNTSTAVESSLASSSVCDSPSILAVCWNSTWGWRWDLSTSGRSLNTLFYLRYLSPSEVRKSRERGRTDLIPPSSAQTEMFRWSALCLCGGGDLQHIQTAHSLFHTSLWLHTLWKDIKSIWNVFFLCCF